VAGSIASLGSSERTFGAFLKMPLLLFAITPKQSVIQAMMIEAPLAAS